MRRNTLTAADRKRWQAFATRVISERAKLSSEKWLPHFTRLERDIVRHRHVLSDIGGEPRSGEPDPRELLVWAWCVLMAAPENEAQWYMRLREATDDDRGIAQEARAVRRRGYAMHGLRTLPEMRVRWLAGLIRAIDADLAGVEEWPSPLSSWRQEHWMPQGYPCFVVPVRRDHRAEDRKERERRAVLQHAIVPARLGDLTVTLKLHPDVDPRGGPRSWVYGAATFDGMTIDVDRIGKDQFRLTGAPLADEKAVVDAHVEAALEAECDVLVWPELSVPEGRLGLIKAALRGDPLSGSARIPLSVAGSWHLERNDRPVNRTEVLHGRGQFLASYDKRRQYVFEDRFEAIEAGTELVVVVTEERLVGIAICRDFCDDCADDVYDWLGVDLVLVPSMGDASSTSAHRRSAKGMQSEQGAVTFVVQQVPVETGTTRPSWEPPAYSFATPPQPGETATPGTAADRQTIPFRSLRARR